MYRLVVSRLLSGVAPGPWPWVLKFHLTMKFTITSATLYLLLKLVFRNPNVNFDIHNGKPNVIDINVRPNVSHKTSAGSYGVTRLIIDDYYRRPHVTFSMFNIILGVFPEPFTGSYFGVLPKIT